MTARRAARGVAIGLTIAGLLTGCAPALPLAAPLPTVTVTVAPPAAANPYLEFCEQLSEIASAVVNADSAVNAGDADAAEWRARLEAAEQETRAARSAAPTEVRELIDVVLRGFAELPPSPTAERTAGEIVYWRFHALGHECLRHDTELVIYAEYGG